jgi:hypothetical protein
MFYCLTGYGYTNSYAYLFRSCSRVYITIMKEMMIVMVLCTLLQNNRHFFQNRHNLDRESIFS